jgi:hypothetical protein
MFYKDVTGINGCVTGIRGNLDECEMTSEDRNKNININDLIED